MGGSSPATVPWHCCSCLNVVFNERHATVALALQGERCPRGLGSVTTQARSNHFEIADWSFRINKQPWKTARKFWEREIVWQNSGKQKKQSGSLVLQAHCQICHVPFPRASPAEEQRWLDPTCVWSGPGLEVCLYFWSACMAVIPFLMHLVWGWTAQKRPQGLPSTLSKVTGTQIDGCSLAGWFVKQRLCPASPCWWKTPAWH